MNSKLIWALLAALVGTSVVACGDDDETETSSSTSTTATTGSASGGAGGEGGSATTSTGGAGGSGGQMAMQDYNFDSKFKMGESPVSYTGQAHRLLLINELKADIGALTSDIDGQKFTPANAQAVVDRLNAYYETFDMNDCATVEIKYSKTDPELLQKFHGDISCANLKAKTAGNDTKTDHKDWSKDFKGWNDWGLLSGPDVNTPTGYVQALFHTLGDLAMLRVNGQAPKEPGGTAELPVHLTAAGHDLQQLVQKFLIGAITYSQGTDDYLDDDVADKGLMASNAQSGDKAYSSLGHAWDEGFGYFGASREYHKFTDDEISGKGGREDWQGYHDTNDDKKIDWYKEMNHALSVNAAKRDRGSMGKTDFTKDAFTAFVEGRKLILAAGDKLTDDEMAKLKEYRNQIDAAWEGALAATVIHYCNDTIGDMDKMDGNDYKYSDHAKHWSELKGFALGLQFNPRGKANSAFVDFHNKVGDKPVLKTATKAERDAYKKNLEEARDALGKAMGWPDDVVKGW